MPLPKSQAFSAARLGAPGPPVPAKQLRLRIQLQRESQWCWAALAVSVDDYFSPPTGWDQCCVVSRTFSVAAAPPCILPFNRAWNQPSRLSLALQMVGHKGRVASRPYPIVGIRKEIDLGTPLGAAVAWHKSNPPATHFVLISGYRDDGIRPEITVKDSFKGTTVAVPLSDFPSRYRSGGAWTHTYETRR